MKIQLLNFYKKNKKSVFVFALLIIAIIFFLFYRSKTVILSCHFEKNLFEPYYGKAQSNSKSNLTLKINSLSETIQIDYGFGFIKEEEFKKKYKSSSWDGEKLSDVKFESEHIFWERKSKDELGKFSFFGNGVYYDLNRLSGQLSVVKYERKMFPNYRDTDTYQCVPSSKIL
jgi:hypothetical protein